MKLSSFKRAVWIGSSLAAALLPLAAGAGTLTGKFVTPTLGAVVNGTLLLTLSQAAVSPGSYAVVGQTVECATSVDGSVVGEANPVATPVGSAFPGVGTLAAGNYWIEITDVGPGGTETLASPELELSLSGAGELVIHPPALAPSGSTGYNVYIGAAPGAETKQGGALSGATFTQSAALVAGNAVPAQNSTQCQPIFNDAVIPSFTYYQATLSDSLGNVEAGYPQSWYLGGTSVDVSTLVPLSSNPAVRFPSPLLSNPGSTTAQSVGSALNLNGFGIVNVGNVGPGFFSSFWVGALPAANTTLAQWTPNAPVVLRRLNVNAQTAGAGGSTGLSISVSDGSGTCTFSGLVVAGALSTSQGFESGNCSFSAGIPLTVKVNGDDHTTEPSNVSWSIEMTAR